MNDEIVDEINALRNDFYEDGGILDELTKIRKLLDAIYGQIVICQHSLNHPPQKISVGAKSDKQ